jgi:hypothetical protein
MLRRALHIAQHEHRNGITLPRIAAMQRFAQIGLGVFQPQLDGFERSRPPGVDDQQQLAQITGWNVERERRVTDIGVVANERRSDGLSM